MTLEVALAVVAEEALVLVRGDALVAVEVLVVGEILGPVVGFAVSVLSVVVL
jgi:hypothetical protein